MKAKLNFLDPKQKKLALGWPTMRRTKNDSRGKRFHPKEVFQIQKENRLFRWIVHGNWPFQGKPERFFLRYKATAIFLCTDRLPIQNQFCKIRARDNFLMPFTSDAETGGNYVQLPYRKWPVVLTSRKEFILREMTPTIL